MKGGTIPLSVLWARVYSPGIANPSSSLVSRAVRGAGWTILTGVGSRSVGLVGTLALTYYLSPEVQGEVANAFIVVLTAHQLSTLGATQYLVAHPKSGPEVAWNVLVFQTVLGVLFFGGVVALRDQFGAFLHAPTMGQYVPGMALAIFIERVGMVPERLLARKLNFRTIGLGRTVGEVLYTGASVWLAWRGWGGMAIVWGNVLRCSANFLILAIAADRSEWLAPSKVSRAILKPVLSFSLPLSVGAFATFATRRFDNLVISRLFGPGVAGQYGLAYNLADVPAVQVGEQIGDVLFPSFAQMDPKTRKKALLRATGLMALVVFPLAVGLGAVAPSVVSAMLSKEWAGVAPMLLILSALSVTRPVGWTVQAYLQASKRPRQAMWLGLAKIVFLLGALILIGNVTKNPLWACGAVGIAFGGHSLASMWVVSRLDDISMTKFLGRLVPPLLACIPMGIAVLGVRYGLAEMGVHKAGVSLVVEVFAGALGYIGGALVVARALSVDFIELVKNAVRRRRGGRNSEPPPSESRLSEAPLSESSPSEAPPSTL